MNFQIHPSAACRRFFKSSALLALVSLSSVLGAQSRAAGGNGEVPRAATAVINTVMSPYCPGLLLANCPSPSADSLRRAIVARAENGATESELRADLVAAYGEMVLAAPPMRGLGAVAWVVPFVLLAGVGLLVFRWLRHQRIETDHPLRPAQPLVADGADADDAERLRRLDRLVRGTG
ncbi:MAG: cytochrome c-type biogenesis protein CcmH [Gemmatimonadaceae bacterium]|nr:cytochrome c-type biogenesis protein CcmH [Gemmatimonadaceae bacterium]